MCGVHRWLTAICREAEISILDFVLVSLFREKTLAPFCKHLVSGIPGHHGIKDCPATIPLGAEDPAQALRLFLSRSEGPRNLDGDVGIGKIHSKVPHFTHDQNGDFASAESPFSDQSILRGMT